MPTCASALRILVVDDNVDGAFTLSQLVKLMGHEVATANDGASAIRLAAEFRPDLILLDIGMPVMNGHDVCRKIRQTQKGQTMLIVAQTGWGFESDRQMSRDAGFDDHLVKPIDPVILQGVIERAVRATRTSCT